MPDLLQSQNIMCSLIFLMEANTPFSFADSSFVGTTEAATHLNCTCFVYFTQTNFLPNLPLYHYSFLIL